MHSYLIKMSEKYLLTKFPYIVMDVINRAMLSILLFCLAWPTKVHVTEATLLICYVILLLISNFKHFTWLWFKCTKVQKKCLFALHRPPLFFDPRLNSPPLFFFKFMTKLAVFSRQNLMIAVNLFSLMCTMTIMLNIPSS